MWRWRMIRIFALAGLLVVTLSGCSASSSLTLDDNGERVALAPGDTIEVTLEGNPTTGFRWELVDSDPTVITTEGEAVYETQDAELVGAGGAWTWTLVAQQPGECVVQFGYHRSWEDEQPEATFSFTANVSD
jgi:inhibitor of cysteine peptidase